MCKEYTKWRKKITVILDILLFVTSNNEIYIIINVHNTINNFKALYSSKVLGFEFLGF